MKLSIFKIWYGLRFFQRTNSKGWYVLASYHHPDSITWRWSLSWNTPRRSNWIFPGFGPSYNMGKSWLSPSGDFGGWIRIPLLGTISISTQQHMWRDSNETP